MYIVIFTVLALIAWRPALENLAKLAVILQNMIFFMSQYSMFCAINNLKSSLSFAILEHLCALRKVHLWLAV